MRMKSPYIISLLFLVVSLQLWAAIPPGYYNQAEGMKERQLKTALHNIIKDATVLKYGGQGVGYTWEGFTKTDMLDGNKVLDRYSNIEREFNGLKAVSGMNIEHAFANSWWGKIENQAYKDLHHLYPSDGPANIKKSNHPIGVVDGENPYDNGVIKVGKSSSRGEVMTAWEPADRYKGDFARTYLYMVTCYEDFADLWRGDGLKYLLENNTYPVFQEWAYKLLLKWCKDDPVDDLERERNESVYAIQGNRNPFIDYPDLAEYIWGDRTSTAFYTQPESLSPELFIPEDKSTIDFGLQALSLGAEKTVTVRGRNLSEDGLTISSSNNLFALSKQKVTSEEVEKGVEVIVNCAPTVAGQQSGVLTFSYDDRIETVTVLADFWDGIPAYEAKNIVCTPYSKKFTASWMKMPGVSEVTLSVYTKDGDQNQPLSGYPKKVTSTEEIIDVPKAATTYYYKVETDDMVSNEVVVVMPAVEPVFSASTTEISFFTAPGRPSFAQQVKLTMVGMTTYRTEIVSVYPFQVSIDGENWGEQAIITNGNNPVLYVRLGAVDEGIYEEEIILSTPDVDDDIVINVSGEANKEKAFFENFENGSKSAYAEGVVVCSAASWKLNDAVIGNLENDKKNDSKSVRLRNEGILEMQDAKMGGVGTLSFYAGVYGTDAVSSFSVFYNLDGGEWIPIEEKLSLIKGEWQEYSYPLNKEGNIRLKFEQVGGSSSKRINIDDITMDDYEDPSGLKEHTESGCIIHSSQGVLTVVTSERSALSLYSLQGTLIMQVAVEEGENSYSLSSGAYIVKVGTQTKVVCL